MKNENIFIMKQPDLGKKISDLRKQQGLTQEELVAKCNINVRTIQRIESGEVTPRSYTIKNILEALGANYNSVFQDVSENEIEFPPLLGITKDNKYKVLQLSWIFGIIYFFLGFPEVISEYYKITEGEMGISVFFYSLLKLLSLVAFFFFVKGFIAIGKIYQKNILSVIAIITLITVIVFGIYDIVSLYYFEDWTLFMLWSKSVLHGILLILLGIGIISLHKNYKGIAIATGILEILTGFVFLIVIPELGALLLFPMQLLEIILIYRITENYRNK